jgi:hypothetical protein
MLLPLAWNTLDSAGVGPVWKSGSKFRVFPLYWQDGKEWLFLPLAWNNPASDGFLPLYWSWKGDDKKTDCSVIPLMLAYSEKAGDTKETHALLGMINYSANPDGYTVEFQPIFKARGGKVSHFSLFWRLFEKHQDDKESFYRFLFLPHKFGRKEVK